MADLEQRREEQPANHNGAEADASREQSQPPSSLGGATIAQYDERVAVVEAKRENGDQPVHGYDGEGFDPADLQRMHDPPPFHPVGFYQNPFAAPFYQIPPHLMQWNQFPDAQGYGAQPFHAQAVMSAPTTPSYTTPRKTASSSAASDPASLPRRVSHNTAEKRRRDKINEGINDIATLLPPAEDGRSSANKAVILSRAVEYIRHLEMMYQHLVERHRNLTAENVQLKQFQVSFPQNVPPEGLAQPMGVADPNGPTNPELAS